MMHSFKYLWLIDIKYPFIDTAFHVFVVIRLWLQKSYLRITRHQPCNVDNISNPNVFSSLIWIYAILAVLFLQCYIRIQLTTLHWRHNDHGGVSNHQIHGCLLNRLFRHRSKKASKLRVTGLCVGNSPAPVNSLHKGPVTRKMFSFDDVMMTLKDASNSCQC